MLNHNAYTLHIKPMADGFFFIFPGEEAGGYWKRNLFLWHEESYFGTFLEFSTHEGFTGVKVDSYGLLTLLAEDRLHSFIYFDWCEPGDALLAVSPIMLESIRMGKWLPDFQADGRSPFIWKVPQMVWDEFNESFWDQLFFEETMREFVSRWYHEALSQYVASKESGGRLAEKMALLQEGPLTSDELKAYFDEQRWHEWTGMADEELPFTMGIRLSEPEDDQDVWRLETVLRDRKKPDTVRVFSGKRLLKKWEPFLSRIDAEQQRWIKLFPWLQGEDGLAEELDETAAWDFLTDSSEKLLALGIEILLPAWWEALKETSMTVKAKVKQTGTNYRPSFVGLDAMLDFDWRLSMNGADLSEEEFQTLVHEQRRLVKIRGQWVRLDPKMIAHLQALMMQAKREGLRVQDVFAQGLEEDGNVLAEADEFDPRAFAQVKIELNQSLRKMVQQLHDVTEIPDIPVPEGLHGELRPYQKLGLSWLTFLRKYGFGAILADDMGLGKTIQLIAYLMHVKQDEKDGSPALIICPTSVLGNWQRELE
ncbi:MAG TPA: SNF2 helicase-associated domain-containing protein, partial [Bacillaceae bacterium]